jgi:putative Ca2+/H+ antiporter (TMEM165/GDT1 family)
LLYKSLRETKEPGARNMPGLKAFLIVFALIFPAEIGDKTQIIILALAAQYRWQGVLIGSFLGFAAANIPAALLGVMLGTQFATAWLHFIAGGLFILTGIFIWFHKENPEAISGKNFQNNGFLTSALLVFIGELGDKTQLVTFTTAANFQLFFPVIAGALLALLLDTSIAIIVGAKLKTILKPKYLKPLVVATFLIIGALTMTGIL